MSEQQYRVIADAAESAAEEALHKLWGTDDQAIVQNAVDALREAADRIERPVPTTEMTAMSHETTGFCFCGQMHGRIDAWNEHDWAALREYMPAVHPAPRQSVPTREQIAEALTDAADEIERILVRERKTLGMSVQDWLRERAALLQKGADR